MHDAGTLEAKPMREAKRMQEAKSMCRTPASTARQLVFALILAAMLVAPIWSAAFPPLLDYPNHLARSFVLAHLNDSHFSFRQFYRADWGAYPYLGMDASLA